MSATALQMSIDWSAVPTEPKRKRMTMTKKQKDSEKRKERLANECCPVHGTGLVQGGEPSEAPLGRVFTYVSCPRGDCDFVGKGYWGQRPVQPTKFKKFRRSWEH